MAHGDLAGVRSVVVVDWPTKDVPDSLVRAGLEVAVHGGPRPEDWSAQELGPDGVTVVGRATGTPPDHADVVWLSDEDRERARNIVEGAELTYVDAPYIGDAARALS